MKGADRQRKENKASKEERAEEMLKKQVYVKMTDGKTIVLEVRLAETVHELKGKMRSQRTCSDNDVYLTLRVRVRRGNDVIGKCGVE